MCGIYGYAGKTVESNSFLTSGISKLSHRGPDGSGIYSHNALGISMCRLAINEVESGVQPFISENKKYAAVFNGEIYNYKDLTKELGLAPHTSEAEIIIRLYEKFGDCFVKKLDGMFAIAIIDNTDNSIHFYRDYFGKKPLWLYIDRNKSIEFASEIKAFSGEKTLNESIISEFLAFGYLRENKSPFFEVQSVPAGSFAIWHEGNLQIKHYWKLSAQADSSISYLEAMEDIEVLISDSVAKRLISERPIGIYLSGGYDSTLIAAIMKAKGDSTINSYSIGFDDPAYDESKYSRDIANFLGLDHHEQIISANVDDTVSEIFQKMDIPFADSSIFPTYLLNKFAASEIVVALTGDGGDEIFGGYDRYFATPILNKSGKILELMPYSLPGKSERILKINRKLARLKDESQVEGDLAYKYAHVMTLLKPTILKQILIDSKYFKEPIRDYREDFLKRDVSDFRKMMLSDVNNYLVGDLLVKADLASMFNSLEVRSPLLDRKLAEFTYGLPDQFLVRGFTKKRILKDLTHKYVPRELLDRPKIGFGVPMDKWLRSDLRPRFEDFLNNPNEVVWTWLRIEEVKSLYKRHLNGENLSRVIWPIFALHLWAENNL